MKKHLILIVDDDEDYGMIIKNTLDYLDMAYELKYVEDGETLMDYLLRRKQYTDPANSPRPGLVLMDINMPKKTGLEVLQEIRADSGLCTIPVIILTGSDDPRDVSASYDCGANSFFTKPVQFHELNHIMKVSLQYWLETVTLSEERG